MGYTRRFLLSLATRPWIGSCRSLELLEGCFATPTQRTSSSVSALVGWRCCCLLSCTLATSRSAEVVQELVPLQTTSTMR
eukprot:3882870-Pleurochrysis_carterae.AAC.5